MENKYDFQVGDEVYCLMFGDGIITILFEESIKVNFDDKDRYYSYEGIICDEFSGNNRTLYHGHNLKITVPDKKAERKRWANIYFEIDGNNIKIRIHPTLQVAEESIKDELIFFDKKYKYITTVNLKTEKSLCPRCSHPIGQIPSNSINKINVLCGCCGFIITN